MNKNVILCIALLTLTNHASAFLCQDPENNDIEVPETSVTEIRTVDLHIDLPSTILPNENVVIDMASFIKCRNIDPGGRRDQVRLRAVSSGTPLNKLSGIVDYYGSRYPFPLNYQTQQVDIPGSMSDWKTKLTLSPVTNASGIVINAGDHIASFVLEQTGSNISDGGDVKTAVFTWKVIARNSVAIPVGSCDVSARNIAVELEPYSAVINQGLVTTRSNPVDIPLTVRCTANQNLGYYIFGKSEGSDQTIFTNNAANPAAGVGIQILI